MTAPSNVIELSRQVAWEMEGVRRGVERYREAAADKNPAELPSGKRLLRECVGPLIEAIEKAQAEARGQLAAPRRQPLWCWPILLLDAERLAVITINLFLNHSNRPKSMQAGGQRGLGGLASVANAISASVRDQLEYERWTAQQKQENAEAKKLKDGDHKDLLKSLQRTYPSLDRRVWAKWRNKVDALREQPWGEPVSIAFGACLIKLLVSACPQYFEVQSLPQPFGGVQYIPAQTALCREVMADIEARAEVARPMRMPMIIPPIPWKYEEAA